MSKFRSNLGIQVRPAGCCTLVIPGKVVAKRRRSRFVHRNYVLAKHIASCGQDPLKRRSSHCRQSRALHALTRQYRDPYIADAHDLTCADLAGFTQLYFAVDQHTPTSFSS
jgi:hypothetical protein